MSKQNVSEKAEVRVERFEYGHTAEVTETCGEKDGSALGTGFAR